MILDIKAKTNSKKRELVRLNDSSYIAYLKSSPENNKANIELIKMIGKELNKDVKIIGGKTSKNKKVMIKNVNKI